MTDIISGYIATGVYLGIALVLCLIAGRIKQLGKELPRKIIHIMAGFGWIIYKVYMEGTIHPIFISSSFVVMAGLSKATDFLKIEREKRNNAIFFFTGIMAILSIISYIFPTCFDAFGATMICLSAGDGMAALIGRHFGKHKWTKTTPKTIEGSVAGVICAFVSLSIITTIFQMKIGITGALLLSILTAVIEILSDEYDNIAIPAGIFVTAQALITYGWNIGLVLTVIASVLLAKGMGALVKKSVE